MARYGTCTGSSCWFLNHTGLHGEQCLVCTPPYCSFSHEEPVHVPYLTMDSPLHDLEYSLLSPCPTWGDATPSTPFGDFVRTCCDDTPSGDFVRVSEDFVRVSEHDLPCVDLAPLEVSRITLPPINAEKKKEI